MKKLKTKQKGITLIALVISIIVMLILAGVSLNLTIGDNGIIKQAQNATYAQSCAILEEYLQQEYVKNYDNVESKANKVESLRLIYPDYFYDPTLATPPIGTAHFVSDSEGHILYLIQKSGLPKDIASNIAGGEAGDGSYNSYANLNDVYGVTSDLKVYYSSGDGKFTGIASTEELDDDSSNRIVLSSNSSLAKLISPESDGLRVADVQTIRSLNINSNSVTSLKDLYALTSLEELTLTNLNLDDLEGIQNSLKLKYVYFSGCTIGDYSALSKLGAKLQYLYLYNINDGELVTLCNGIYNANFPNLRYFAVVGEPSYINSTTGIISQKRKSNIKYITSLAPLSNLKSSCIGNVQFLSLECNEITDEKDSEGNIIKYALQNLTEFTNLTYIRIERNKISTLKGIEGLSKLEYVYAGYNELGKYETYNPMGGDTDEKKGKNPNLDSLSPLSNKPELIYLYLQGNVNLKWVSYIKDDAKLSHLYFGDGSNENEHCINMIDTEVATLRAIFNSCGSNKSYPSQYWLSLLDETNPNLEVSLNDRTITKSQFETLGSYTNIKYLNLKNVNIQKSNTDAEIITAKADVNELATSTLSKINNLKYLNLESKAGSTFSNFNDLSFLKGEKENDNSDDIDLIELDAFGTQLSTKEKNASGDYIDYNNGLKMLVTNRYGLTTYYSPSLINLEVNESHINLGDINEFVKRIVTVSDASYFNGPYHRGLYIDDATVISTLSNCSGLTTVTLCILDLPSAVINLNNGKNSELTSFVAWWRGFAGTVMLPSSCSYVAVEAFKGTLNLGNLQNFKLLTYGSSADKVEEILKTVSKTSTITEFIVRPSSALSGKTCFDIFRNVYMSKNENERYKINIKSLYVDANSDENKSVTSLSGIEYITGLENLSFTYRKLPNLKDISALESQKDTLTTVSLPNCSIADARVISKLSNLVTLNLENNCLLAYVDESSGSTQSKWYTIKEICDRMRLNATNKNQKVTVKLKGNSSIIDWSGYTSDTSKWTTDSSYGAE